MVRRLATLSIRFTAASISSAARFASDTSALLSIWACFWRNASALSPAITASIAALPAFAAARW